MAITLSPDLEAKMTEDALSAGYTDPAVYVEENLNAVHEREVYLRAHRGEIAVMIDEGLAELDRGEFLTPEQVKENMRQMKVQYLSKLLAA